MPADVARYMAQAGRFWRQLGVHPESHQLARLHHQGVPSDAAYAAAKRRILEQDRQPQSAHDDAG